MDIRIGDIVRFLTEKLEGKVSGVIDSSTVNVYVDEYGFEIPAAVNDLVVVRSDFSQTNSTPKINIPTSSQKSVSIESANTVYLAIVPDNFNNLMDSRYELFLVNDTTQICLFSISYRKDDKYTGIIAGNCNPGSYCSIGLHTLKEIDNNIKAISIQCIFFQKGEHALKNTISTEVKINTVSLCKSGAYKHTRWFDSIATLRPLDKENSIDIQEIDNKQLQQAIKEKQIEDIPTNRPQKQIVNNIVEVDLHCNQLLETTAGMESKDILEYQLDVFKKTMEEFKLRRGQKIVFIHGKGDGVLRQRILWELQGKYKRHNHQDASFKQYGYGATMVSIK